MIHDQSYGCVDDLQWASKGTEGHVEESAWSDGQYKHPDMGNLTARCAVYWRDDSMSGHWRALPIPTVCDWAHFASVHPAEILQRLGRPRTSGSVCRAAEPQRHACDHDVVCLCLVGLCVA